MSDTGGRPLIGVTMSSGLWNRFLWLFHWFALRRAGARPVRITVNSDRSILRRIDGVVIGGGDDIGPDLYDGDLTVTVTIDPERDRLEMNALEHAFARHLPVLGICRGMQMLNVVLGGTLHQEIREAFPDGRFRRTVLPRKTVRITPGTRLAALIDKPVLRVNSLHHQAIRHLADPLQVSARDDVGIIQAVEDKGSGMLMGVQWHPELLPHAPSHRRLFAHLVQRAKGDTSGP